MSTQFHTEAGQPAAPEKKFFTLEQANRALPYITRIAEDIRAAYRRAVELHERMDQSVPEDDVDLVRDEYERTIANLNRYVDELHEVGVELKDYEVGLIDFPALHEGREICLCWKSGEGRISAWHETDAGFAGRQDVSGLHETCEH